MALSCGIIGLPLAGKTTLFNLLTRAGAETSAWLSGKTAANVGHAEVPDERLEFLSAMFKPKKTTYAQIEVIDVPGLLPGLYREKGGDFLAAVRGSDALVQVVRAFSDDAEKTPDILRDVNVMNTELLFADLLMIETRLARINSGSKKKTEHPLEEAALLKCRAMLEEEKPLKLLELSDEEKEALKHITFLTNKPMLLVVNLDENQLSKGEYAGREQMEAFCREQGMEMIEISARAEEEIEELEPEERAAFLSELGLSERGLSRVARAVYRQLGLISFLTAGEDEVRAWPVKKGSSAKSAAGKIHSDIERGFIRAETVAFARLKEAGSMAAAREKGHFRLEGKDYQVQDGDIINFRFNV
ncbi:MAG: redox-regulated ATPase YchF [Clostridiales bacterium]|nr:redox-regulated ATPase YchF [Clostridiales bacterium]